MTDALNKRLDRIEENLEKLLLIAQTFAPDRPRSTVIELEERARRKIMERNRRVVGKEKGGL